MKPIIQPALKMRVERFGNQHSLQLVIKERPKPSTPDFRWYASFDDVDVKGDGVLIGSCGNGATPFKAIRDYAAKISLKTLAVNAWVGLRREIQAPTLT